MTDLTQPRAAFDALANKLNDAGIPVESVSGNVGAVEVSYAPFATQAQKDQGAAIVAGFDWTLAAEKLAAANDAIREQLNALDIRYGTRACSAAIDGDRTLLDWLNAEKDKLRAQFQGGAAELKVAEPDGNA